MKWRVIHFVAIGLLVLAGLMLFMRERGKAFGHKSAPHLAVDAVPRHPHVLSENEVDGLLSGEFHLVQKVDQIPDAVRESFYNFVEWPLIEGWAAQEGIKVEAAEDDFDRRRRKGARPPLDMADPGQELGSDDLTQGLPQRRLILCGFSPSASFMLYEQGGYASSTQLLVFDFKGLRAWGGWIEGYNTRTLDDIRRIIKARKFKSWNELNSSRAF